MPSPEAPNYQYPDDIPHVSGDIGTAALAVRKDQGITLVDTDGDYTLMQTDARGHARITTLSSPPKFLPIVATLLGPNIIVPLTLGKRIQVLNYVLASDKKVGITWTGLVTPLTGILRMDDNVMFGAYGSPDAPLFETLLSEPVILTLDTPGVIVGGHLTYIEVT